jgi:hypothetical protein
MRWCSERKQSIIGTEFDVRRKLAQSAVASDTLLQTSCPKASFRVVTRAVKALHARWRGKAGAFVSFAERGNRSTGVFIPVAIKTVMHGAAVETLDGGKLG